MKKFNIKEDDIFSVRVRLRLNRRDLGRGRGEAIVGALWRGCDLRSF